MEEVTLIGVLEAGAGLDKAATDAGTAVGTAVGTDAGTDDGTSHLTK